MMRKRAYKNRVEVLQGTLDMLILKTLQGAHSTDMALCELFAQTLERCCKSRLDRYIPLCIV
jgi:hypothetical protein